jgi:hypothetical protein
MWRIKVSIFIQITAFIKKKKTKIGFIEKRRKLTKIAENSAHNIDPIIGTKTTKTKRRKPIKMNHVKTGIYGIGRFTC